MTGPEPFQSPHRATISILTHPDRPIQVVNLYDYRAGPRSGDTFRVIPSEMWSVQNNLSLANMDWAEFADSTDEDGIFRGFA